MRRGSDGNPGRSARSGASEQLRRLLARARLLPTESIDFDAAAAVYRSCRSQGKTVRKLIDCLIAAVAMRAGVALLHMDQDFTSIAGVTELRIDDASLFARPAAGRAPPQPVGLSFPDGQGTHQALADRRRAGHAPGRGQRSPGSLHDALDRVRARHGEALSLADAELRDAAGDHEDLVSRPSR